MDPLTQALLQRELSGQGGQPPAPAPQAPVVPPSGGQTNTPPQAKRFQTAQDMMEAYRNGWSPNPVLLQVMSHGKP